MDWKELKPETLQFERATEYREDRLSNRPYYRKGLRGLVNVRPHFEFLSFVRQGPTEDDDAVLGACYGRLDAVAQGLADGQFNDRGDYLLEIYCALRECVRDASLLLSTVAGGSCSVAIKTLWQDDDNDSCIVDFMRDPINEAERSHYSPPNRFPPIENSAFESILFGENQQYYAADNLVALEAKGLYKNCNPHWKNFYNSTAVHSIGGGSESSPIIGFFCTDLRSGALAGKHNGARIEYILFKFAELVYYAIRAASNDFGQNNKKIGWVISHRTAYPLDSQDQDDFQKTLGLMESLFFLKFPDEVRGRLLPALRGGDLVSHYQDGVRYMVNDDPDAASWGLSPEDQSDKRLRRLPRRTSDKEFVEILEEIAPYDDYAKELLVRARKAGIGKE